MQNDWRTKYRKPHRNWSFRSWEIWIYSWVMRFFHYFFSKPIIKRWMHTFFLRQLQGLPFQLTALKNNWQAYTVSIRVAEVPSCICHFPKHLAGSLVGYFWLVGRDQAWPARCLQFRAQEITLQHPGSWPTDNLCFCPLLQHLQNSWSTVTFTWK